MKSNSQSRSSPTKRCNQCAGCLAKPCLECRYCKDRYGGPLVLKQVCIKRRCLRVQHSQRRPRQKPYSDESDIGSSEELNTSLTSVSETVWQPCGACPACVSEDCGICLYCVDKTFHEGDQNCSGGACERKQCMEPVPVVVQIPSAASSSSAEQHLRNMGNVFDSVLDESKQLLREGPPEQQTRALRRKRVSFANAAAALSEERKVETVTTCSQITVDGGVKSGGDEPATRSVKVESASITPSQRAFLAAIASAESMSACACCSDGSTEQLVHSDEQPRRRKVARKRCTPHTRNNSAEYQQRDVPATLPPPVQVASLTPCDSEGAGSVLASFSVEDMMKRLSENDSHRIVSLLSPPKCVPPPIVAALSPSSSKQPSSPRGEIVVCTLSSGRLVCQRSGSLDDAKKPTGAVVLGGSRHTVLDALTNGGPAYRAILPRPTSSQQQPMVATVRTLGTQAHRTLVIPSQNFVVPAQQGRDGHYMGYDAQRFLGVNGFATTSGARETAAASAGFLAVCSDQTPASAGRSKF